MAKTSRTNQPSYNVRAKTGRKDQNDRDIFVTVGAAWPFANGDGFNLKVNMLPVGFDGQLMLVPPKED